MTRRPWFLIVGFTMLVVGTAVYWALVWALTDPDLWLSRFPYVSPAADLWMASTGALAAVGLYKRRRLGLGAGYLSAGACVFVGLTAFHHNLFTGQLYDGTPGQWVETVCPAALLVLGLLATVLLRKLHMQVQPLTSEAA